MKRVLLLLLCLVLVLSASACKKEEDKKETTPPASSEPEEEIDPVYADNPHINRFFKDYIAMHGAYGLDRRSIRRAPGTADTPVEDLHKEYLATINGMEVTVRDSSEVVQDNGTEYTIHQLHVTIEGGTTEASLERMLTAFNSISCVLDSSCSSKIEGEDKTVADKVEEYLMEQTEPVEAYRVSNYLEVIRFQPIFTNAEMAVSTACRIELVAYNYVAE